MKSIGIIGAENSHSAAIAKIINIQKRIPGFRAAMIWGETRAFARKAAEAGQIPQIVKDPADMLGQVDAVLVDHRHGKFHLPAVKPFLEARIPIFVDKPFCYRLREGKTFLDRARKLKVPVTSFSVLPKQKSFKELKKEVKKLGKISAAVTTGPCDIKSKYGGVFFYGIHQVGLVLEALGYDVESVELHKGKINSTATMFYTDGKVVTMNLISEGHPPFHFSAVGEKGRMDTPIVSDDNIYLGGVREFTRMFKTGKTVETRASILTPVAVLEAFEKSLKLKRRVRVASID